MTIMINTSFSSQFLLDERYQTTYGPAAETIRVIRPNN